MAVKRTLRKPSEIRGLIEESGIKYIMLNNRIFDLYKAGKVEYNLKHEIKKDKSEVYIDHTGKEFAINEGQKVAETTFNERDFIIFILLNFLDQLDYKGYSEEIADYLGYSDKRVKERLKKLQFIQAEANSTFNKMSKKRVYVDENDFSMRKNFRFIDEEKQYGYENGKRMLMNRWYIHYGCDYKQEEVEGKNEIHDVPVSFFHVTIYDLDLFTKGLLNEKEFITYLFMVKSYNSKKEDTVNYSTRVLSENLGIKNEATTEKYIKKLLELRVTDKFCEEGQDFPLVHSKTNKNHQHKLATRSEPSYKYFPIYNNTTMQRLRGEEIELPYESVGVNIVDTNETNTDTNFMVDSDNLNIDSEIPF